MITPEIRYDSTGTEAITVQEVKEWGKMPGDVDDQLISEMIADVREMQENYTGRSFIQKTITAHWDKIHGAEIVLPMGPIRSITSIKRVYEDGTLSDALTETTDYYVSGMDFKRINLYKRWQSAGQILTGLRIEYVAGHGSGNNQVPLPGPIRKAMLRQCATDYYQRDDLEVYQPTLYDWVKEALAPYRIANLWL